MTSIPTTRYKLHAAKGSWTPFSGLAALDLSLMDGDNVIDTVRCTSGQPNHQVFRQGWQSQAGSMEPLPEGYYDVSRPIWAGAKNDFNTLFNAGLGPVVCDLTPKMQTSRSALEIHWDYNLANAPGTAGCLGIIDKLNLVKFLSWFDNPLTAPNFLTVNWGLGSVETWLKATPVPPPAGGHGGSGHAARPAVDSDLRSTCPNHASRNGVKIDTIVIHNTEGSLASAVARFQDASEQVSAHFINDRLGKLTQMVDESQTAWHAGVHAVNQRSVGIENVAGAGTGEGLTVVQEVKLIALVKYLMEAYEISKDRILPHRAIVSTDCPGSIFATDAQFEAWKKANFG